MWTLKPVAKENSPHSDVFSRGVVRLAVIWVGRGTVRRVVRRVTFLGLGRIYVSGSRDSVIVWMTESPPRRSRDSALDTYSAKYVRNATLLKRVFGRSIARSFIGFIVCSSTRSLSMAHYDWWMFWWLGYEDGDFILSKRCLLRFGLMTKSSRRFNRSFDCNRGALLSKRASPSRVARLDRFACLENCPNFELHWLGTPRNRSCEWVWSWVTNGAFFSEQPNQIESATSEVFSNEFA